MRTRHAMLIAIVALLFASCHQKAHQQTIYFMHPELKKDFSYQAGTYWIYKDSVSGEIDSAYVVLNPNYYSTTSCTATTPFAPMHEGMSIIINVATPHNSGIDPMTTDEQWTISAVDSTLFAAFSNRYDTGVSMVGNTVVSKFPFAPGVYLPDYGCLLPKVKDSGRVDQVLPTISINSNQYTNVAISVHQGVSYTPLHYTETLYVNSDAGLVKVIFDFPSESLHRVLELQRYHINR
jgi:hypothetical protein